MARPATTVVCALVVACTSAAADARSFEASDVAAVKLSGSRVLWIDVQRDGDYVLRQRSLADGRAGRERDLGGGGEEEYGGLDDFDAAGGRVAYAFTAVNHYGDGGSWLSVGPEAGPFDERPVGCSGLGPPPVDLALTPEVLVLASCALPPGIPGGGGGTSTNPVEVRDLRDPAGSSDTVIATNGSDVRAAGSFVAWRAPEGIAVYDRRTAGVVLRVTYDDLGPPVGGYDLDADGSVLMASGRGLFAASPQAPAPRLVTREAPRDVHAAAGRALLVGRANKRNRVRLRLLGADGRLRTLRRFAAGVQSERVADFDGSAAAWVEARCFSHRLRVERVADLDGRLSEPSCRPRIASQRLTATRGGRVARVRLRCPLTRPGDCRGRVEVRLGEQRVASGRWTGYARVGLRTTKAGRALLRGPARPRRLRVVVRERGRAGEVARTLPLTRRP